MAESRNFWRGENIRLRAFEPRDFEDIPEEADTELDRYIGEIGLPLSRDGDRVSTQEYADRHGKDDMLVLQIETLAGQVVGSINTFDCEKRYGTFRYAIGIQHKYWRTGYGREALTLVIRYYFRELRYQKCNATVYAFNQRSIKFHESFGFRFEGRIRNMVFTNGQFYDELWYGLTAAEFEQIDPLLVLE